MVAEPQGEVPARLLSVADYERLTADTDTRYELIDGELIEMPGPSAYHQRVLRGVFRILDRFVLDTEAGEVFTAPFNVQLSDEDVLQPDILFVSINRSDIVGASRAVGAPDLVVEISSPRTAVEDLGRKRRVYRESGVREYWFIDTEARAATIWVLEGRDYDQLPVNDDGHAWSKVVPGFTIDMARVFTDADQRR
jgi:Uma2 family endonuclease